MRGDNAAIIRLQAEAGIMRVVRQPLERIRGLDLRHARFADLFELRNDRVGIDGSLVQCPKFVGSTGRQDSVTSNCGCMCGPVENGVGAVTVIVGAGVNAVMPRLQERRRHPSSHVAQPYPAWIKAKGNMLENYRVTSRIPVSEATRSCGFRLSIRPHLPCWPDP